jgi:hypothetical protein
MLSDLKIVPPKKEAFTIETADFLPRQHTLCCWSGKRGSGKSCACANFVQICRKLGVYDRVWLICGTYESNRTIWQNIGGVHDDDVILPTKHAFAEVLRRLDEEKSNWDKYLMQMKAYKEYHKTDEEQVNFFKHMTTRDNLNLSKPKWPYKKAVPPRCCVVLDDVMGEDLVTCPSSKLTKHIIAHRHWAGGLGISVHMLVQSYCSRESLPRPIREQLTVLCLFNMAQTEQIKKVWSEADLPGLSFECFLAMCRHAWAEPHSFLTIDFAPKSEEQRYRVCMDEYLDPAPFLAAHPFKE